VCARAGVGVACGRTSRAGMCVYIGVCK
jgi:hypothetical protein